MKRAMHSKKRALISDYREEARNMRDVWATLKGLSKEPYLSQKEPYILWKEPYIPLKRALQLSTIQQRG